MCTGLLTFCGIHHPLSNYITDHVAHIVLYFAMQGNLCHDLIHQGIQMQIANLHVDGNIGYKLDCSIDIPFTNYTTLISQKIQQGLL